MSPKDLPHGLYIFEWQEDGGVSVVAVGSDHNGDRWYAPTNWTTVPCYHWDRVKRATLVMTQKQAIENTQESETR